MPRNGRNLVVAALLALAMLATTAGPSDAAASACDSASAVPSRAGETTSVRATVCLINAVRRRHGLRTLRLDSQLSRAARDHSRDMVRRHYFAHNTPEGESPAHRVLATGYVRPHRHWVVGETLAWWRPAASPARIVAAWMHSAPHRKVILTPSFRDIGIGVVLGVPRPMRRGGATYTADFGRRN
jgi:uncharacterized protein YkwD